MRRATRFLAIGSLLLAASFPAIVHAEDLPGEKESLAPATAVAPAPDVVYAAGRLRAQAEGADLALLLEKVAEGAGLPIEIGEGVSGMVSVAFSGLTLEEGVPRILDAADSRYCAAEFVTSVMPFGAGLLALAPSAPAESAARGMS